MDKDELTLKATSPMMHERVQAAVRARIVAAGLEEVRSNPELWVTYHTDSQQEVEMNTTSFGYGYGAGWTWDSYYAWGPTTATTSVYTYTRGTLIVDLWDAKTNKLIFRGSATSVVPESPEKGAALIDKAVNKIGDKFRKMYARDEKAKSTSK
jgi:hypothetical protein